VLYRVVAGKGSKRDKNKPAPMPGEFKHPDRKA
jgi:hypothetical protein